MLTVKDLHKSYQVGKTTYEVLKGVSLTVEKGEFVAVMGPSGSGKTTLLNCISCYIPIDSGEIMLGDRQLANLSEDALAKVRNRQLGFVFQDFLLLDGLTVRENILLPAIIGGAVTGQTEARADQLCDVFGISAIRDKYPAEISGGEKQRISIARALLKDAPIVVLDEATAGLDPVVRGELLDLFLEFIQDERHSIVMSSHITADLEQIADSIAYLHNGQLLFQENKDDLLQEYGVLHCGEDVLTSLPAGLVVFTRRGAYGCESLVRERRTVQELLPEAVCDAARLDDIMRFYSGRDAQ